MDFCIRVKVYLGMSNNKQSKYLLYNMWTSQSPSGFLVSGSMLYDLLLLTEDDAKKALKEAELKHKEFRNEYSGLFVKDRVCRFVYIENDPEWWS